LAKLPRTVKVRIADAINQLTRVGEHKKFIKLEGAEGYRLRVGEYRVLYCKSTTELTITVVKIGPRGDVYHE
jgi:mRNA interferase RelE/StbE